MFEHKSEPFLGEIRIFSFNFVPNGWAQCDGQLLPINQNTALFDLLGTTYGGNGTTDFALPDLRGRAAIHFGQGPGLNNVQLGQSGGASNVTLSQSQLPPHSHPTTATINCNSAGGNSNSPVGRYLSKDAGVQSATFSNAKDNTMAADAVSVDSGITGGGQPIPTQSPFLGLNFCIALEGSSPSKNCPKRK
jgi:microcystin-dependent protein